MSSEQRRQPVVSGISPKEGMPGTTITLRGENLGTDSTDLVALIICDTDCLLSAQWKSSTKIIARVGQAKRGIGEIILVTKSGGRGVSNVQFRVFIEQVGPLVESPIWVDESRTVPTRSSAARNVAELPQNRDALGIKADSSTESSVPFIDLLKLFPDSSGNLRMENFNAGWYLLENHKNTSYENLERGISNLKKEITKERQSSNDTHKNNLYSLIDCVDALYNLHMSIESDCAEYGWPLTTNAKTLLDSAMGTADGIFSEVLSRKDRADCTRNAMSLLTRFRFIFFLVDTIDENMTKGDYASILNDYARAKALFKDSDTTLFKEILRVLEIKMQNFKDTLKQKLIDTPTSYEEQSRLIKYLKILDPTSNPAWECITAYHCWLEKVLWDLQNNYSRQAAGEDRRKMEFVNVENVSHYVLSFISELLSLLTDKLLLFWKLAQNYSDASDEKYLEQQDDINQMLTNTINVSSWLIWNALMPSGLPEQIVAQYENDFASWKGLDVLNDDARLSLLVSGLKSVRLAIKSLLESQFSRPHVQPLMELSKTIRLKCLEIATATASRKILALAAQETWNVDIGTQTPKTGLPDLYESELNEILTTVTQVLSSNGYPGEEDLFLKENIRQVIVNRFIHVVCSFKDCCDQLLRAKKRPNKLNMEATEIVNSDGIECPTDKFNCCFAEKPLTSELNSRKLLICVCNLDYILHHSLPTICKRFSENGIKFADLILEQSKHRFSSFQRELIGKYLEMKQKPLELLISSSNYDHLPDEEDVSLFVKEVIMGVVFIKAELRLLLPQLTFQILSPAVESLMQKLLDSVAEIVNRTIGGETATQIVIDITALERTFQPFLSDRLLLLQSSIKFFHQSMQLAIEGLKTDGRENVDLNASDVKPWALFSDGLPSWRLTEMSVVQFVMLLGSYLFFNYRLYTITIGMSLAARKVVRVIAFCIALMAHLAYFMFYIYILDGTFIALAFYYHTMVITFVFYLFELFADNIAGLNDVPLLTSRTLHTTIAVVFAIFLTGYGVSVTHAPPKVLSVPIKIQNLPSAYNGFSIALLTDIHIGPTVHKERIEQIVEIVNELKADSVAISGDLVDSFLNNVKPKAMPLKNLKSNYGTFFASGNHDYYHSDINEVLQFLRNDLNFTVFHNAGASIRKDDKILCFAGVDDLHSNALRIAGHGVDVAKAISDCPTNSTIVLLAHQPNLASMIIRSSPRNIDLILSGHTHGGQFYIFWLIAYLQNAFLRGLYLEPKTGTQIFVSAGVNYWGPPVKMRNLCEIIVVRLYSADYNGNF
ncbi:hypothetical protein M3Y95_00725300 [Aphelenchoides besseyi]|nr:hypothetical protein M3Y95_00725300 [Aphelenchoides besseyi]